MKGLFRRKGPGLNNPQVPTPNKKKLKVRYAIVLVLHCILN
jgi:hypothetical protein